MEDQTKYKEPYKVPEGYFDGLYGDILEKKGRIPEKDWPMEKFSGRIYAKLTVALVSCALITAVIITQVDNTSTAEDCLSLSCIDDAQLLNAAAEVDAATLIDYASSNSSDSTVNEINLEDIDEDQLLNEL